MSLQDHHRKAVLEVLYKGLLRARGIADAKSESDELRDILNMLHNIPLFLRGDVIFDEDFFVKVIQEIDTRHNDSFFRQLWMCKNGVPKCKPR